MTNAAAQKSEFRRAALARRQAIPRHQAAFAAQSLVERTFAIPISRGTVVAGYRPIRGEIDPAPLMRALAGQGAVLALPTIAANHQPLIFRAWQEGDPMQLGALGIMEPKADAAVVVPDIVLVPLAAFDRRGHRIGYGAGHYDRALATLRMETPVIAIGMAFAAQQIPRVPNEAHDVPLDLVLTESEVIDLRSG